MEEGRKKEGREGRKEERKSKEDTNEKIIIKSSTEDTDSWSL